MPYAKFEKALTLMAPCVEAGDDEAKANKAWDKLFTHIHATFAKPVTAYQDGEYYQDAKDRSLTMTREEAEHEILACSFLLKDYKPGELFDKVKAIPPVFAEFIFPVAVARCLLRDFRIAFNPRKIKTFHEFHRRYAVMILCGDAKIRGK